MRWALIISTFAVTALAIVVAYFATRGPSAANQAPATDVDAGPARVLTTFYPTTYFAQRIAGDLANHGVEVACPVPEGEDPIFWQPTAEQVGEYQRADLIVLNGAGFERWAANAALPSSRVVDTAAGFAAEFIIIQGKTHSHGTAGSHNHEGLDGHTWLDPRNAAQQSLAIANALVTLMPEHRQVFENNAARLTADLTLLGDELSGLGDLVNGVQLLASHPAYNYISRRFDWGITSFDLDPGDTISAQQLAEIQTAQNDRGGGRTVMLWESEPADAAIATLDSIGVRSVVFSPAEMIDPTQLESGEDYLSLMRGNIERLRVALTP